MLGTEIVDIESVIDGAVDTYGHANPDFFKRSFDDIGLATAYRDGGFIAGLHRHHWSATAERARIASDATHFNLLGAILLNASVGGLDPYVAEMALKMGAVWVSMPCVSAKAMLEKPGAHTTLDAEVRKATAAAMQWPPKPVLVTDGDGHLLPEVLEVLRLVKQYGAVLSLGYIYPFEHHLVAAAATDLGIDRIVVTNPQWKPDQDIDRLSENPGVYFEFTVASLGLNTLDPPGPNSTVAAWMSTILRRVGVGRCVLATSCGMADLPPPREMLRQGCQALAYQGISAAELQMLVKHTPATLLRLD